jgi:hypothetical protein
VNAKGMAALMGLPSPGFHLLDQLPGLFRGPRFHDVRDHGAGRSSATFMGSTAIGITTVCFKSDGVFQIRAPGAYSRDLYPSMAWAMNTPALMTAKNAVNASSIARNPQPPARVDLTACRCTQSKGLRG